MREESGNIAGIREQLITTDKGAVKQCIRNVVTVLENDPKFKGAIRYNMMTDRNDIVKGLGWYRESPALTDSDIDHIMLYLEEHYSLTTERSIEDIKSFISRQSDIYKVPYETQPKDRPRQCVFGGTSNAMDTLPLDRTGNRRFMPVMVYPDRAECHILKNEELSRKYIEQVWAEAMEIYRSGEFRLMLGTHR